MTREECEEIKAFLTTRITPVTPQVENEIYIVCEIESDTLVSIRNQVGESAPALRRIAINRLRKLLDIEAVITKYESL